MYPISYVSATCIFLTLHFARYIYVFFLLHLKYKDYIIHLINIYKIQELYNHVSLSNHNDPTLNLLLQKQQISEMWILYHKDVHAFILNVMAVKSPLIQPHYAYRLISYVMYLFNRITWCMGIYYYTFYHARIKWHSCVYVYLYLNLFNDS